MAPRPDSLLAGLERVDDVLSYEFMADFRVHARLRRPSDESKDGDPEEEVVKAAYLTLPPAVGMSAIAPSCYSCFDYTNGLADLVVGYMGAPFDGRVDEMTRAPLMVTVRNNRGARMLDTAVGADRVHVILDGGYAGTHLPSHGDRTSITLQTVRGDSLVRSLTDATFIPATQVRLKNSFAQASRLPPYAIYPRSTCAFPLSAGSSHVVWRYTCVDYCTNATKGLGVRPLLD